MKFVADENIDRQIVIELRSSGHDVTYIAELKPGIHDFDVLEHSLQDQAVLITADKDFGEIVFRQRRIPVGVLLLRLLGVSPAEKASKVRWIVEEHGTRLAGAFSVATPGNVRIRRLVR